jgi:hypothetical protein
MASQGWIFLNDATNLTSLLGGLGGIIAASQILKQSLGTTSRIQTATELLKQCNTYTLHIKKMIHENGEELRPHVEFVIGMETELEQYDYRSPLSAYSHQYRMERDILRIKGQLDTSNQWREELNYWGEISSEIRKVTRSLKDHQTVLAVSLFFSKNLPYFDYFCRGVMETLHQLHERQILLRPTGHIHQC